MSNRFVAVVGGGLAGLTAAWRIARAGVPVVVYERSACVGGRARAGQGGRDGAARLPPLHQVAPTDRALLALVAGLGLERELLPLRPRLALQLARPGRPLRVEPGWRGVLSLPRVRLIEALRTLRLERLMGRFASALDPEAPECAAVYDDRSLADFGRLYFGPSVVEHWMETRLAEWGTRSAAATSRVAFLLWLGERSWIEAGTLRGDPARIAEALAARVEVRTAAPVARLEPSGQGRIALVLGEGGSSAAASGRERVEADAVVLATPPAEAARVAAPLLHRAEVERLAELRLAPSVSCACEVAAPGVGARAHVAVARSDSECVAFVLLEPRAGARSGSGKGGPAACLARVFARAEAGERMLGLAEEAVAKELAEELSRLFAGVRVDPIPGTVERFEAARPEHPVGSFRSLARLRHLERIGRRAGRRLYLAGDWLALPTLDGAVRSGERAARSLLEDWGVKPGPP